VRLQACALHTQHALKKSTLLAIVCNALAILILAGPTQLTKRCVSDSIVCHCLIKTLVTEVDFQCWWHFHLKWFKIVEHFPTTIPREGDCGNLAEKDTPLLQLQRLWWQVAWLHDHLQHSRQCHLDSQNLYSYHDCHDQGLEGQGFHPLKGQEVGTPWLDGQRKLANNNYAHTSGEGMSLALRRGVCSGRTAPEGRTKL